MAELQQGHHGGILGLRLYVAEHAEAITYDLLSLGYHLYDIPDRLSYWELKAVIAKLPADSALVREIVAGRRAEDEAKRLAAMPEEDRPIGSDPISIDEMNDYLGWEVA